MYGIINYFRGSVTVAAECASPEMFLNFCTRKGVEFWNVRRISATEIQITVHRSGYKVLAGSRGRGFEIKTAGRSGLPNTVWGIRKRYALIAGALFVLAAIWTMSLFVWEIDVYGNEEVSSEEILETLDGLGVKIGSFGPSVVSEDLANHMLLEIDELSWFAINITGSHATVLVRERTQVPDIVNIDEPSMVFASKGGVISKMSVLDGTAVCGVGDTVAEGDILVTGISGSISSGTRFEHAMAEIYARTWYEMSAQTELQTYVKSYTGEKKTKYALNIGGRRINLYFNSGISWGGYDKIFSEKTVRTPTGSVLPLVIIKETYTRYVREKYEIPADAAEEFLKQELLSGLRDKIGDGEITETEFETTVANGVVRVTLKAECYEQIASLRALTEEEKSLATETETNIG